MVCGRLRFVASGSTREAVRIKIRPAKAKSKVKMGALAEYFTGDGGVPEGSKRDPGREKLDPRDEMKEDRCEVRVS